MGFIAFIGLFVVLPVVALLSDRSRRVSNGQGGLEAEPWRRLAELESKISQQQEQIEALRRLVAINILKQDDDESFRRKLGGG